MTCRKINLLIAIFIIVFSTNLCKKDEKIETLKGPDLTKIVIGRGYDVTGRYAYSPEIKEAILDHDLLYKDGKILEDKNLAEANFLTRSGNTITEYQSQLAVSASVSTSVKALGVSFTGEVGTNFNKSKYESSDYAFATSTSKITKTSYYVDGKRDPKQLLSYLNAQFKSDLSSMTGKDIILKYGTHVMLGGIWGARLDYHMTAKKKSSQTGNEIGAYAQAKVEANFAVVSVGVGTSVSVDSKYENYFETSSIETTTNAYGGSPEYARSVHDKGDYDKWVETIADNPIWCDYYSESLQPIYEFISDATKKQEVLTAYDQYLFGKKIVVSNLDSAFTVINNFSEAGFTYKIGGGDSDVNTQNGRNTEYEFTIEISKSGTNIIADLNLRVKELASNYTELQGVKTITIPVNKNITTIDLSNTSYTIKGIIPDSHNDWVVVTVNCPFITTISIRLDGGGGNDATVVGLKGTFNIPIHFRP